MGRIILLTEAECAPHVAPVLAGSGATVEVALTRADLIRALACGTAGTRLLAFGAGTIVPEAILQALPGPAYNVHPGPPAYPGLFPSVHALLDRQTTFGVTLHEMIREVDSGPIVAVDLFEIPSACTRLQLDTQTFTAMMALLKRLAPALAAVNQPLPRDNVVWSGKRRTRADFRAACQLPEDCDEDTFAHRLRAIGEGPDHALTVTRFGRTFRLVSEPQGPAVRAGLAISG